jgi:ABC-2 type transport system ATP-binding protein
MIKAENLVKRYGSNYALNDVSFEIAEGEIVGLLGPNGAGKSTAMNILTGYLSTTSGAAYINGINILEDPIAAKKQIGEEGMLLDWSVIPNPDKSLWASIL